MAYTKDSFLKELSDRGLQTFHKEVDEAQWLKNRLQVITATEAGALLGVDGYKSAQAVRSSKQIQVPFTPNGYTNSGHVAEEAIIHNGLLFVSGDVLIDNIFVADMNIRLGATPDGITTTKAIVEAKATGMNKWDAWQEHPPMNYMVQAMVQMFLLGTREAVISASFFAQWPFESLKSFSLTNSLQLCDRVKWDFGDKEAPVRNGIWKIAYSERLIELLKEQVTWFWENFDKVTALRVKSEIKKEAIEILMNSFEKVAETSPQDTYMPPNYSWQKTFKSTAYMQAVHFEGDRAEVAGRLYNFIQQSCRVLGLTSRDDYMHLLAAVKTASAEEGEKGFRAFRAAVSEHLNFIFGGSDVE